MTPCARGCCWTPYSCGSAYACACHWEDHRPRPEPGSGYTHRDPTATQAIRNVMNPQRDRRKQ